MPPGSRVGQRPTAEELAHAGAWLAQPENLYGRTLTELAEELGISRRTLYRWRCRPEFGAAFEAVYGPEDADDEEIADDDG